MKTIYILLVLLFTTSFAYCDSIPDKERIEALERTVQHIDKNQLNYQIEKDLLKETYSTNATTISWVSATLLALAAVASLFGVKSINDIKDKFKKELSEFQSIKNDFDKKSKEYDELLDNLSRENLEQDRKIRQIEFKEKSSYHITKQNYQLALDYANEALKIEPDDVSTIIMKASLLCTLNQFDEVAATCLVGYNYKKDNEIMIYSLVEALYFANRMEEANRIIKLHPNLFNIPWNGFLLSYFRLLQVYWEDDITGVQNLISAMVTVHDLPHSQKKIDGWLFEDAEYFIAYKPDSKIKTLVQNTIWYWNGSTSGHSLLTLLDLEPLVQNPIVNQ